jgi:multidrug efflux pump subunit AcrA (membrane-fusion protein)
MPLSLKQKAKSEQVTIMAVILAFSFLLFASCSAPKSSEANDTYTCPMHPTVVSDKQGVCPVCGMDLVRKARPGEEVKITEDLGKLLKSTNEVVISSISTIKPEFKSMPVSVEVDGVVTYDLRNIFTIPARVGGRLEKYFIKSEYQYIKKGQKIAEIYSVDLVNAQRELIYLLTNDASNQLLIESAKKKLQLLGATQQQIEQISITKEPVYTFSIYSSINGFVISDSGNDFKVMSGSFRSSSMGSVGEGMKIPVEPVRTSTANFLREGNYVTAGQILARVVNTNKLWIELNVPGSDAPQIKKGDLIEWTDENKSTKSTVDLIEPFFSEGEEFVKVRCYVSDSGFSIGQLVEGKLETNSAESLWIPQQSVLDLGMDKIVFVKERGVFKPRKVVTGLISSSWIQIVKGVASSEELASNAQYLIDSENFVKTIN